MSAGPSTSSSGATPGADQAVRLIGHVLSALLAVGNVVAGVAALAAGLSTVLALTLLVSGTLMVVLAWYSYRRARAAWAFLVSMTAVFGVFFLFGAPRISGALSLGLNTVFFIPALFAVATIALILLRGDYVERDTEPV
jgi:hypothetical protein